MIDFGIIAFGLVGLLLGSFLNVIICRLPNHESIVLPGSRCPGCKTAIKPYDNIPVFSYLILKGKCRACGTPISWQYPVVELITGLLLALLYWKFGWTPEFLIYSILALFLLPIAAIDLKYRLILNKLTVPGFILGMVLMLGLQIENWKSLILGALCGGLVIFAIGYLGTLLFKKESMGMGDVKLFVMIGIYIGLKGVLLSMLFSVYIAAIFILGGLVLRKLKLGETIPFGPFIAIGSLAYLMCGDSVVRWYLSLL